MEERKGKMIKTVAKIEGMMCAKCEAHMNDAIMNAFAENKINSTRSSHTKGETVILSETVLDENKLREVTQEAGYTLLSCSHEPYQEKKGFFSFLKKG